MPLGRSMRVTLIALLVAAIIAVALVPRLLDRLAVSPSPSLEPRTAVSGDSRTGVYSPPGAGFAIQFPGDSIVIERLAGAQPNEFVSACWDSVGGPSYVCRCRDVDQPFPNDESAARYLHGCRDFFVELAMGAMLSDNVLHADGAPGREFVIELREGTVVRERVYLAGSRFISLAVWGRNRKAVRSADAERFLGSLRLAK
jgi:hypothetical protein